MIGSAITEHPLWQLVKRCYTDAITNREPLAGTGALWGMSLLRVFKPRGCLKMCPISCMLLILHICLLPSSTADRQCWHLGNMKRFILFEWNVACKMVKTSSTDPSKGLVASILRAKRGYLVRNLTHTLPRWISPRFHSVTDLGVCLLFISRKSCLWKFYSAYYNSRYLFCFFAIRFKDFKRTHWLKASFCCVIPCC